MPKIMYFTLTSVKKRLIKLKYSPNTAISNAKNPIATSTQQKNAPAGFSKSNGRCGHSTGWTGQAVSLLNAAGLNPTVNVYSARRRESTKSKKSGYSQ